MQLPTRSCRNDRQVDLLCDRCGSPRPASRFVSNFQHQLTRLADHRRRTTEHGLLHLYNTTKVPRYERETKMIYLGNTFPQRKSPLVELCCKCRITLILIVGCLSLSFNDACCALVLHGYLGYEASVFHSFWRQATKAESSLVLLTHCRLSYERQGHDYDHRSRYLSVVSFLRVGSQTGHRSTAYSGQEHAATGPYMFSRGELEPKRILPMGRGPFQYW